MFFDVSRNAFLKSVISTDLTVYLGFLIMFQYFMHRILLLSILCFYFTIFCNVRDTYLFYKVLLILTKCRKYL